MSDVIPTSLQVQSAHPLVITDCLISWHSLSELFIYKGISNEKKVILLRQAVALQGIDPSELAFIGHMSAR